MNRKLMHVGKTRPWRDMMEVYKIQRRGRAGADWSRTDPRWDNKDQGKSQSMQEVALHPAAVHLCCQEDLHKLWEEI